MAFQDYLKQKLNEDDMLSIDTETDEALVDDDGRVNIYFEDLDEELQAPIMAGLKEELNIAEDDDVGNDKINDAILGRGEAVTIAKVDIKELAGSIKVKWEAPKD